MRHKSSTFRFKNASIDAGILLLAVFLAVTIIVAVRISGVIYSDRADFESFMRHNETITYTRPLPTANSKPEDISSSDNPTKTRAISNVSNVKELFPLLAALAVLMGFEATLLQMRLTYIQNAQANLWKKKEFAFEQLMAISKDRSVQNVKNLLEAIDTPYGTAIIIEIPNSITGILELQEIAVDKQLLLNGVTPDPGPYRNIDTGEVIRVSPDGTEHIKGMKIAWEIDRFFVYLIGLRTFVNSQVIEAKDLEPFLHYWLRLIIEPKAETDSGAAKLVEKNEDQAKITKQASVIREKLHEYIIKYFDGPPGRHEDGEAFFICQILGISEDHPPFKVLREKKSKVHASESSGGDA